MESEQHQEEQPVEVFSGLSRLIQHFVFRPGALLILWGWVMFYSYAMNYLTQKILMASRTQSLLGNLGIVLGAVAFIITIFYLLRQAKPVAKQEIYIRYVWVSLLVSLVLINLIQYNVLQQINFELQHPIYMVVIAFAIVVSGGILRYPFLLAGGIIFGILAYVASLLSLTDQLLMEAIGWLVAFILPGHIRYYRHKN
ncbi:hypothetical protein [Prolixibacter denitrificans]|uniref:Uncharacterized protein n=1 Tax=Prolixibacter denitrificans TaxID=1541063 RepID=A0A2P8C6E2_9BACT|nr:hypothetical protein [Prolixibacter denitrificans]PSK80524.1 hypothetical protein CLV93_11554 [Prolixibacter denitrificans]GET22701.1 hypothetical protein JCM18694_29470 [Prolixibacter denitrificans]